MNALFADLDGTLIFSHRVRLPGERLCVEYLNGREQSYMTQRSCEYLSRPRDFALIPVTTRSPEQFARLAGLMAALRCRDALVCNGGILLRDGVPDAAWLEETRAEAATELPALTEAVRLLHGICDPAHVHEVAGLMVYAVVVDAGDAGKASATDMKALAEQLSMGLANTGLRVLHDRRKLYCVPASIDKGLALTRCCARLGVDFAAAIGDSDFDLPMLEAADLAILPRGLASGLRNPNSIKLDDSLPLSDQLCELLERGSVFPPRGADRFRKKSK